MFKSAILFLTSLVCVVDRDVVVLLQKKYDKIKDLKSDFIQSYYSSNGTLLMESSGTLYYKKSGMFRWVYENPKKKEFVIKENKLYVYLKDDEIVYVDEDFKASQMRTILLFLYGEGSIENEFNVEKIEDDKSFYRLFLSPKERNISVSRLIIHVKKASVTVEKLEIIDNLGNRNTFHFKNTSFNTGIKESFFIFKVPENVEISPIPKDMFR